MEKEECTVWNHFVKTFSKGNKYGTIITFFNEKVPFQKKNTFLVYCHFSLCLNYDISEMRKMSSI